ncbi:carbonic anhydrase 1-like [Contarinia nasturtii]|uniref:carbonic anhydrase 1-like n=1 Tax=Contarinia nasturtii TaxID=265458 RepID=UPI0012D3A73D|nr:carbonic anhydrase 1-like [Contarinia nasturtii]XP_031637849.1 carbonic anhydrase 1-like [Contarinia nasturtii]
MNLKSFLIYFVIFALISIQVELNENVHLGNNGSEENESDIESHTNSGVLSNDYDKYGKFVVCSFQSPIDLRMNDVKIAKHLVPLRFFGHWNREGEAYIENTGKSAEIKFEGRDKQPYILTGGLFDHGGRYIFEQIHFHWGENNEMGSEHKIDGKSYSMEGHLVHYNSKYSNFNEASKEKDGLVVVTFFFDATGNKTNPEFAKISNFLGKITEVHSKFSISSDSLKWMESQDLDENYFTYRGSLTTPPYYESVTWIIYRQPIKVSTDQIEAFRSLKSVDSSLIENNIRPIQIPRKQPKITFII